MTAKAKSSGHTTTVRHGNVTITTTRHGDTVTTSRSTKHGDHKTTVTVEKRGGKIIRKSTSVTLVRRVPKKKETAAERKKKEAAAKKRGAPAPCATGTRWITGGNDWLDTCVPVAAANSLLLATGYRTEDWQLMAMAGATSIADVLASLGVPHWPAGRLAEGVILGVAGDHAVTVHDGAAISWGTELDLAGLVIEEAWQVDWRQAPGHSGAARARWRSSATWPSLSSSPSAVMRPNRATGLLSQQDSRPGPRRLSGSGSARQVSTPSSTDQAPASAVVKPQSPHRAAGPSISSVALLTLAPCRS